MAKSLRDQNKKLAQELKATLIKKDNLNKLFIQNIEDVIALVDKTLGKSFSVIEY